MNFSEAFAGKMIQVLVPVKAAANFINRANTPCTPIRPLIRYMWLRQAETDFVVKAVYNKSTNNDYLFHEFINFDNVSV